MIRSIPIPQYKIVYASLSSETNFWDLYSINPDSSEKTRLTTNFSESTHSLFTGRGSLRPFCSPDGTKIAVTKHVYLEGDYIYVMNSDGTGLTLIGDGKRCLGFLDWSPDGAKLAFSSGNRDIYTMNIDGSGLTRLTFNEVHDYTPRWSPDGTKIGFTSGASKIYIMNSDGSELRFLVSGNGSLWSPDGTKILYSHGGEICIIDADGTNQVQLTNNEYNEYSPQWSPDGTEFVFISDRAGNQDYDLYIMNIDGTNERLLIDRRQRVSQASWLPDGSKIVFIDTYDENPLAIYPPHDIFTINPDGSGLVNLTNDANFNQYPSWLLFPNN